MTKEEILEMEAGGNLNEEVGREIFGLLQPPFDNKKGYRFYPLYSIDISAAWQVVEKMKVFGWCLVINPLGIDQSEIGFVPASNIHSYWSVVLVEGDITTAPEAICKAALLAKLEAG